MAKKAKKNVKKAAKASGAKSAAKANGKSAKSAAKKPVKKAAAPSAAKNAKAAKAKPAPKGKTPLLKTAKKLVKNLVSASLPKKAVKAEKQSSASAPAKKGAASAAPVKLKKPVETKPIPKVEAKKAAPKEVEEVVSVDISDDLAMDEADATAEEVVLTDAEGRRYCRVRDCDQLSSVDGYCRYHYLLFWKRIQVRKKILTEGKLEKYVEDLTARYPDKFLEMLKKDLRSEKDFLAAIQELEIDEGNVDGDFEDEDQSFIDEVRGMSDTVGAREEEEF